MFVVGCTKPASGLTYMHYGLQTELAKFDWVTIYPPEGPFFRFLAKIDARLGLMRTMTQNSEYIFAIVPWCSHSLFWPLGYKYKLIPYIYDCWGPGLDRCESLLKRFKVKVAFFSSKDVATHFEKKIPELRSIWAAEACDPRMFNPQKNLIEREVDVFEMGRRYSEYHDVITSISANLAISHEYSGSKKGDPTVDELYTFLGQAKIVPCFPKKITNPRAAGEINTMTQRYLEAIGSRCLIVGEPPPELIDLFGFDPVIHVEWSSPVEQLKHILENLDSFQPHVDYCAERLVEVATFEVRARQIHKTLISL